jgi:hypothetical protein
MNFYFCLYSNKKYQKPRKALSNLAKESKIFENTFEYDREWLEKTYFFEKNSDVLGDTSRGDGWWLWKPYVILKTLEKFSIKYIDPLPALNEYVQQQKNENNIQKLFFDLDIMHPNELGNRIIGEQFFYTLYRNLSEKK